MLKIADLLDELGQACELRDISVPYSRVLSDANFLVTKAVVGPEKWREDYRSVFGCYPSQESFLQNADDAIHSARELQRFARTIWHLNPKASIAADELVSRLQNYSSVETL